MDGTKKNRLTKRKFALAAAALVLLLLIIAYVPLSSDEIKEKVISTVAEQTGYQVEVNGSFNFYLSLTPGFEATGVRIMEGPESDAYGIKRLSLNVSLFSLLRDETVVTALEVEGMEIKLDPRDGPGAQPSQAPDIPAIKYIRLIDIMVTSDQAETLYIDDWKLKEELVGNNLRLEGKGRFNGQAYTVSSTSGSLNQLIAAGSVFPVQAKLQIYKTEISVKGSITEPLSIGTLQADIEAKAADFSAALGIAGIEIPASGMATASAKLTGSLDKPSLKDLQVTLSRGKSIAVQATGAIDNLYAPGEESIRVKGTINKDKEFFQWLMPDVTIGEGQWQISGVIVNKKAGLLLTDIQIQGEEPAGYSMSIKGEGIVDDFKAKQPFSQLKLNIDFKARQKIARALFNDAIPGMGDLQGRFQVNEKSESAVAVSDIDFATKLSGEMPLTARGKINHIPLDDAEPASGLDIELSLDAKDSVKLGELLETGLPDISPVKATARLAGTTQQYLIKDFTLKAGEAGKLHIGASGDIDLHETSSKDLLKEVRLKVDSTSTNTRLIANVLDVELPELGPVKAEFNVQGNAQQLKLTNINLRAGSADGLQIEASGEVRKIELEPEFRLADTQLAIMAKAESTASLTPFVGFEVPDFGAVEGRAKVLTRNNLTGLHEAEITASLPNNRILIASGKIVDLVQLKGISWDVDLDLDSDESFQKVLGYAVDDLDAVHGDVLVSDEDGSLGLEEIVVTSKQEGLLKIRLKGLLDDIKNREKMDVSADITTSNLKVIGSLLGQHWPDTRPAKLNGWFRVNDNRTNFDGSLLVGETTITADISALTVEPRVKVNGEISSRLLHLEDFGLLDAESGTTGPEAKTTSDKKNASTAAGAGGKIFSDEPLPLDWMKQVDLDMKISVADVADAEAKLESFDIPLQISDGGVLRISPARVDYEGGAIELDFTADASSTEARTIVKLKTDDLPLDRLANDLDVKEKISGSLNIFLDLDTKGNSPAAMASNLNGAIEFGLEEIEAPKEKFDLLTKNLFGWVVSSTVFRRRTRLDCGIVIFEANKGQLTSKLVFFDGTSLTLSGEGSMDLGQETIDFYIIPKEKRTLLSNANPVHLTGPLRDPNIGAVSSAEVGIMAAKGYAGLAILPTVTIPVAVLGSLGGLFAEDESKGDNSACLKYAESRQ